MEHVNREDVGVSHRRIKFKMRGRAVSSSRAVDIVTAEQKARRLAPDSPVHSPRDSLLSWSSGFTKYEGMFNWGALLLIISSVRVGLENLIKYGFRVSPAGWVRFIVGDLRHEDDILNKFPALYLMGYVPIFIGNADEVAAQNKIRSSKALWPVTTSYFSQLMIDRQSLWDF